ncbi:protein phosphatase 2C domain-containing protein [Desulfopila sp. IMCC35008]|uniref:protein phosphatase 2C domain-containing protein n=1 Tax=Desulfopila sp. IMCC35008 TaxID=2653858 RepID=UPI0013D1DDEA|nr:protein phosphatase 2C domain-containing protein [Desulfopila sp. IMCC35008]
MYLSTEQLLYPNVKHSLSPGGLQSLHLKGSGHVNEDVLLVDGKTYGVFDGATSLHQVGLDNGKTGGLIAATIAAEAFKEDNSRQLHTVAVEANERIAEAQRKTGDLNGDRSRLWSTSMGVVRVGDNRLEYCQSGDAVILVLFKDGGYRLISTDVNIDRETLTMWKDMAWCDGITIHEALADQIRTTRQRMNVDYGVLNGESEAIQFLKHGAIDLADISDVILCTDGLFLPREEPAEDQDWRLFTDLYQQGGLHLIHDHIHTLQESDPDCRKYPRFKKHDDIAALALPFSYLSRHFT